MALYPEATQYPRPPTMRILTAWDILTSETRHCKYYTMYYTVQNSSGGKLWWRTWQNECHLPNASIYPAKFQILLSGYNYVKCLSYCRFAKVLHVHQYSKTTYQFTKVLSHQNFGLYGSYIIIIYTVLYTKISIGMYKIST